MTTLAFSLLSTQPVVSQTLQLEHRKTPDQMPCSTTTVLASTELKNVKKELILKKKPVDVFLWVVFHLDKKQIIQKYSILRQDSPSTDLYNIHLIYNMQYAIHDMYYICITYKPFTNEYTIKSMQHPPSSSRWSQFG